MCGPKEMYIKAAVEDLRGQGDHAETLWALIVFHNFLSERSIHLKMDFFFFLNQMLWQPTYSLLSTAVDDIVSSLAQQLLLSHCALPHQSAHTGGATNECSWGLTMQKQMGDEIFSFAILLGNPMLYIQYCPFIT